MKNFYLLMTCTALLAGCAVETESTKGVVDPNPAFVDADEPADARTQRIELQSQIRIGARVEGHYKRNGYVGYEFAATAVDDVTISVSGVSNDPIVFLYGPKAGASWDNASSIAMDDDSGEGLDSRLSHSVRQEGMYLILIREYEFSGGAFNLSLNCAAGACSLTECPDEPVCGSDDVTYANRCDAVIEGVTVQYEGACTPVDCRDLDCDEGLECVGCPGASGLVYSCLREEETCEPYMDEQR